MNIRNLLFGTRQATPVDLPMPYSPGHTARRALHQRYLDYYRGHHRRHLVVRDGQGDDNIIVNYAQKIVDESAFFLFGRHVAFEVDKERDLPEEQYLGKAWADRPLDGFCKMAFLNDLAISGGIFGTAFVRLYPGAQGQLPRLVNLNPMLVDVETEPDDMDAVLAYIIVWRTGGEEHKRDRIERTESGQAWTIQRQIWRNGVSKRDWADDGPAQAWPWPFPPIFHCKNLPDPLSFWGASDLVNADLNDAINFVRSNTGRIVKHHAHPKTVGLGIDPSQIVGTAIDGAWCIPGVSPDRGQLFNLEMSSDLASSRAFAGDLVQDFHAITSTPNLNPAELEVGALSGFALRILYGPQLNKTEVKRRSYGGMLSRINAALLITAGKSSDQGIVIENIWDDPLPISGKEQADELAVLVQAGAGVYGAARVAGYTEEQAQQLAAVETFPEGWGQ